MLKKIWTRAIMLIGAATIVGGASAATAQAANAQPPVVVVRPYYRPPVVVYVGHPYWHRWYDYRFREWRYRRDWR
jgi:hypothetical protein